MRPPGPWQILHVDLEAIPPRLELPAHAGAALIYFRLRGAVLGLAHEVHAAFPMPQGEIAWRAALATGDTVSLLRQSDLRPRTQAAWDTLWACRAVPGPDDLALLARDVDARRTAPAGLTASVVICTCRRPDELAGCLDSLKGEIAVGREIVVVDNGPDDDTRRVVEAHPGVRYATALRPGLSHARNVGLRTATGDVVAFVDDDVRPEPGWVDPLLAAFEGDVDVACGLVLPFALEAEAQIAFQYDLGFGGMGLLPLRFDRTFLRAGRGSPPVWTIGAGANMAVRRLRALELGGFDERIGPGAAGGCGDDSEFWSRVLHADGVCVYQPLSVVRHRHRPNWDALRRQARGYGFGHIVGLFAQYARSRDPRDLRRAFTGFPAYMIARTLRRPLDALRGRRDRLLWAWWGGYLRALGHLPLAFARPERFADRPPGPADGG